MQQRNLKDLTDEGLILEFQNNNTVEAFEILMQRYKNPLMNYAYRFLGDYEICTDIVEETFIRLFRYKNHYSSIAKFSTWIYTIAGNLARTEYRKRRKRKILSIERLGEEDDQFDIPDERYRPDIVTDRDINEKIIQNALLKVSDTYREAVILRDIQGLSYEEIAEITKTNEGTIKSRINRGRAQLQKLLKGIYKE